MVTPSSLLREIPSKNSNETIPGTARHRISRQNTYYESSEFNTKTNRTVKNEVGVASATSVLVKKGTLMLGGGRCAEELPHPKVMGDVNENTRAVPKKAARFRVLPQEQPSHHLTCPQVIT